MNNNTYSAISKYQIISPFKVRRVAKLIRNSEVNKALSVLDNLPHRGAVYLSKVIKSCLANMKHNHNIDIEKETVSISTLLINGGPLIKRFRPQARGRMFSILKRTSHIEVSLKVEGRVS